MRPVLRLAPPLPCTGRVNDQLNPSLPGDTCLSSNSKCNTTSSVGLRCCHTSEQLYAPECRRMWAPESGTSPRPFVADNGKGVAVGPSTMSRKRAGAAISSRYRTESRDDLSPSATTAVYTAGPLVLAVFPDPPGSGVFARTDCQASPRAYSADRQKYLSAETTYYGPVHAATRSPTSRTIGRLRQARKARRPRSHGADQRGQFPHITARADHPTECEPRVLGH